MERSRLIRLASGLSRVSVLIVHDIDKMNRLLTSSSNVLLSLLLLSALISCGGAAATPQSTIKSNKSKTLLKRIPLDNAAVRGVINRKDISAVDNTSAFRVRGGECCDTTPILLGKVGIGAGK